MEQKRLVSNTTLGLVAITAPLFSGIAGTILAGILVMNRRHVHTVLRLVLGAFFAFGALCRPQQSVLFEGDLLVYLRAHNYPCPSPLSNVHRTYVGIYHEKPYMLFAYLDGEHIEHPRAGIRLRK